LTGEESNKDFGRNFVIKGWARIHVLSGPRRGAVGNSIIKISNPFFVVKGKYPCHF